MDESNEAARRRYDPILWQADHEVLEAFDLAAEAIQARKRRGTGVGSPKATKVEEAFRKASLARLRTAKLSAVASRAEDEPEDEFGENETAEINAIDIRRWPDPVMAVLYAAMQAAAHDGMRGRGPVEPNLNQMLLDAMRTELRKIAEAYGHAGATLPPGRFLHAGVASMQEGRDHLGSDLAVVVGVNIGGFSRYRVALFQAKHEKIDSKNRADVGQGNGTQLQELLKSRMGYYLFYPRPVAPLEAGSGATRLLPVVRNAVDVTNDINRSRSDEAKFRVNCYVNREGEVDAVDFAQFVALVMTSSATDVGLLFSTAAEVSAALTTRGRELLPDVVAIDCTGLLSCHEFLVGLEGHGYKVEEEFAFPSADEMEEAYERSSGSFKP